MYKINKEFHFSSSHQLQGLPESHPCSRLHGHNYVVNFHFQSDKLNEVGFVIDYRALSSIKDFLDNTLDHQHLNDVFSFNPSAENISKYLYEHFKEQFPQLFKVEVSETPKTKAVYEP
ncbi:MAG: 6-pyruvoyl trahydropterin synthase family protein [Mangrovibacterium sp.]